MKKAALALVVAAAALFGLGQLVAAGGTNYSEAIVANPASVPTGGQTVVTYQNCEVGETITFSLPQFTPATQTAPCGAVQAFGLSAVLPLQATVGEASATFVAPATPGTYNGTGVGTVSPELPFTVTVTGSVAPSTTVAPTIPDTNGGGSGSQLPSTGSGGQSTITFIAIGLLTVGLGLFAVAGVRRRSNPAAT